MNVSVRFLNTKHVRVLVRALVCNMLLVLPSCAIPPLRQAVQGPAVPASFKGATGAENSSQLGVEEFFSDSTLTHLMEQALAGNRELRILNEEVQIARNDILARQGTYLPFITVGAQAGLFRSSAFTPEGASERELTYPTAKHFPDPLPNFLGALNLAWQLDIWRELRNARDAAVQRYRAASERRNYFVTRMVAEIAENYYELMALDQRLVTLDQTIKLQKDSRKMAEDKLKAARGTALAVQRFQAEVRKNQSEKLIVYQEIVEAENRINFLLNRFPQPVERKSAGFFDLNIHTLSVGVPAQLLQNRPDIRQAERELQAAGLDVNVARAHFFPRVDITSGVGYQAFSPQYLFNPEALIYTLAGNLAAPLINKKAIQAEYQSANAKQLESVYNYQRVILNAFTEVINRLTKVQNYSNSIALKKQQLESLEASVNSATKLYQNARAEYIEVLFAQRDLLEARTVLIEIKRQQLSAIVNTYQALGGGIFVGTPRPRLGPAVAAPPGP